METYVGQWGYKKWFELFSCVWQQKKQDDYNIWAYIPFKSILKWHMVPLTAFKRIVQTDEERDMSPAACVRRWYTDWWTAACFSSVSRLTVDTIPITLDLLNSRVVYALRNY